MIRKLTILSSIFLYFVHAHYDSKFYDLTAETADGETRAMSEFEGKVR